MHTHSLFLSLVLSTGLALASLPAAPADDLAAIKSVVTRYKASLEKLDASAARDLFTADSQVFESGGVEGTFAHYLEHHIGPELAEFKEFTFRNYSVDVRLDPPFALVTESYLYRLVLKAGDRIVERQGVTTSVLKKINDDWRFVQTHSSSRALPGK